MTRSKPTAAKREIEVLSHAFTKAVEWGIINRHPFKGEVRLKGAKPRDRYVEDWEIVECLDLPRVRRRGSVGAVHAYIRLKLLTGLRRGDMLRLRVVDCQSDGIHVTTHKTGRRVIYEWTTERLAAVEVAKASRPVDISPFLFCNAKGECYLDEAKGTASGFNSMWQNFMTRVLKETKVSERFTEHDLRAKCASDALANESAATQETVTVSNEPAAVPRLDWIDFAIRQMCEIPDRDSPEDFPEALIVTAWEIRNAIECWMPDRDEALRVEGMEIAMKICQTAAHKIGGYQFAADAIYAEIARRGQGHGGT